MINHLKFREFRKNLSDCYEAAKTRKVFSIALVPDKETLTPCVLIRLAKGRTKAKSFMDFRFPVDNGVNVHLMNEFIRDLNLDVDDDDIRFLTYKQYGELLTLITWKVIEKYWTR
jgi:hypothetical protein